MICPENTFASHEGALTCTACPAGAKCPAGTVIPLSSGLAPDGQQFPFLIELETPGAEEILIGTLLIDFDQPYVKVLIGTRNGSCV